MNKNGTYDCSCDEFFAEDGVDPITGRPLACVDDDECQNPDACGENTQLGCPRELSVLQKS